MSKYGLLIALSFVAGLLFEGSLIWDFLLGAKTTEEFLTLVLLSFKAVLVFLVVLLRINASKDDDTDDR